MNAEPPTVTLTIGLDTPLSDKYRQVGEDEWTSTPVTVLDAVIGRAAGLLVQQVTSGRSNELTSDLRNRARRRIDEEVTAKVGPIIDEALAGSIQLTNNYGEPTGKTVTLRELIVAEVGKQLKINTSRDLFRSKSAIDEAIATTAKSVVAKELADAVAEAKQTLRASLTQSVAETMSDTIIKAMARP